jgi:hypothetical protein
MRIDTKTQVYLAGTAYQCDFLGFSGPSGLEHEPFGWHLFLFGAATPGVRMNQRIVAARAVNVSP